MKTVDATTTLTNAARLQSRKLLRLQKLLVPSLVRLLMFGMRHLLDLEYHDAFLEIIFMVNEVQARLHLVVFMRLVSRCLYLFFQE